MTDKQTHIQAFAKDLVRRIDVSVSAAAYWRASAQAVCLPAPCASSLSNDEFRERAKKYSAMILRGERGLCSLLKRSRQDTILWRNWNYELHPTAWRKANNKDIHLSVMSFLDTRPLAHLVLYSYHSRMSYTLTRDLTSEDPTRNYVLRQGRSLRSLPIMSHLTTAHVTQAFPLRDTRYEWSHNQTTVNDPQNIVLTDADEVVLLVNHEAITRAFDELGKVRVDVPKERERKKSGIEVIRARIAERKTREAKMHDALLTTLSHIVAAEKASSTINSSLYSHADAQKLDGFYFQMVSK